MLRRRAALRRSFLGGGLGFIGGFSAPIYTFTSATSSTTASYNAIVEGAAGQTLELVLNSVSQGNMAETSAGVYELDVVFTQRNNTLTAEGASLSVVADEIELTLSVLSTTTATILCNQAFKVDWDDDGTFTSYTAATTASNTYSPANTGDVPVRVSSVGNLELTFSNGNWNFNTSALTNAENLTYLLWIGQNTGTGDIANLPSGLTFLNWTGQNTGTGDIANLPSGLTLLVWAGNNTGTGDIANLPSGLTFLNWQGQNTGTGDIANLPSGLTLLVWQGQNTGTGDIANLPSGLTLLNWAGNNTGTGDIANLPSGLTFLNWQGQNTGTGDIANLPSGLTLLVWAGNNTGTGDIANLPSGLTFLNWTGQNTGGSISATGAINPFPTTMRLIRIEKGINEATVDKVLEWAADVTTWQSEKLVDLLGNSNAAPSAAGDAFIPTIIANGATVQTA